MTFLDANNRRGLVVEYANVLAEMWNARVARIEYAEEREHPEWVDHGGEA